MTRAASSNSSLGAAFSPLSALLKAEDATKLNTAIRVAASRNRHELIERLKQSVMDGKRVQAYALNTALTMQGIPPVFRYPNFNLSQENVNQKNDLFISDMRWLEHTYMQHLHKIRFSRYKAMFTPILTRFCDAADYVFYQGQRPAWRIVASLALEDGMQHECAWLRSEPIRKIHQGIAHHGEYVKRALEADLATVVRSSSFSDEDAKRSLERRYALWVCSQMTRGSPTETAKRYEQMTGQSITRYVAFDQLKKINLVTKKLHI
jgi:hypothetical protein